MSEEAALGRLRWHDTATSVSARPRGAVASDGAGGGLGRGGGATTARGEELLGGTVEGAAGGAGPPGEQVAGDQLSAKAADLGEEVGAAHAGEVEIDGGHVAPASVSGSCRIMSPRLSASTVHGRSTAAPQQEHWPLPV